MKEPGAVNHRTGSYSGGGLFRKVAWDWWHSAALRPQPNDVPSEPNKDFSQRRKGRKEKNVE